MTEASLMVYRINRGVSRGSSGTSCLGLHWSCTESAFTATIQCNPQCCGVL